MGGGEQQRYRSGTSHKIDARPVHILFYTGGVPEHSKMAETRKREIQQAHPEARIFVREVNDLGKVSEMVDQVTGYGPTREFAIWSHAALDGPKGEEDVSGRKASYDPTEAGTWNGDRLHNQLYLDEWASIDFNWAPLSFAVFYGCRTAMGLNWDETGDHHYTPETGNNPEVPLIKSAFAYRFLEEHPDLFAAAGQPWYTVPSEDKKAKSWEPTGYSKGEAVYSVAWQGDDSYYAGDPNPWYLEINKIKAVLLEDGGFKMRLFYTVPEESTDGPAGRVVRTWPNVTTEDIQELKSKTPSPS